MPVPQRVNFIVKQAGEPVLQRVNFIVKQAGEPVHKELILL